MHKILKSTKLFIAILCVFMLCSGIVLNSLMNMELPENVNAGCYSMLPAYQPENSYQLASTVDIAVVNLDEGVKLRERTAYYAGKLITFPNEHFHMTGLDDAKKGLEAGIYGAYIIIPATFSRSVESINDKPEKATIQYTVNGDNNSASLASVVNDINTFATVVSENITYIYVSAILDEYHTAQDNTKTILKNDSADLDNINNISPESLLGEYEYVMEGDTEYNSVQIDMNKYEVDSENIIDTFSMDLRNAIDDNERSFEGIKKGGSELRSETDTLQKFLQEMEPLKDKQEGYVYANGFDNIEKILSEHNKNTQTSFAAIEEIIKAQNNQTKNNVITGVNAHLASQSNALQSYVNLEINNTIQNAYREAFEQEYINFERNGMERMRLYIDSIITHEMDIDYSQREFLLGKLATASDALAAQGVSTATMSNAYNQMMSHISPGINISIDPFTAANETEGNTNAASPTELEAVKTRMNFPIEEIRSVLKKDVEGAIENSVSDISTEMYNKASDLSRKYEDYLNRLDDYDPYAHLNESYISRASSEMERNMNAALSEMRKKQSDDEKFVYDIRRVFDENLRKYDESIYNANEATRQNVINIVNELRSNKESNRAENTKLMEDFSNKLSYTRVGSIGNSEAYNFISSPIKIQPNEDSDIEVKSDLMYNAPLTGGNEKKIMHLKGAASVGVISLILMIAMLLYSVFTKEPREE